MPQLQNLVLTDRATPTPVDHTFIPREITNGVGTVVASNGVPVGDKVITVSLRRTPQDRYKAVIKGRFPITQDQTIGSVTVPVVVRTANVELTFSFDATSTEQERTDVVGMLVDALGTGSTLIHDTVVKLQGVY